MAASSFVFGVSWEFVKTNYICFVNLDCKVIRQFHNLRSVYFPLFLRLQVLQISHCPGYKVQFFFLKVVSQSCTQFLLLNQYSS